MAQTSNTSAEAAISWVLDFMQSDLNSLEQTERWLATVNAHKHLSLWNAVSLDGKLYPEPARLDLVAIQKELRTLFDECVRPFIEGRRKGISVPASEGWPPRAFVAHKDTLHCTRTSEGKIEKRCAASFFDALLALVPLPLERFKKCESCGKYFFPTGRRVRKENKFCSRSCNLRETARRQRARLKAARKKSKPKGGKK